MEDNSIIDPKNHHSRPEERQTAKKLYAYIILAVVIALVVMSAFMGKHVKRANEQSALPQDGAVISNSTNHVEGTPTSR